MDRQHAMAAQAQLKKGTVAALKKAVPALTDAQVLRFFKRHADSRHGCPQSRNGH